MDNFELEDKVSFVPITDIDAIVLFYELKGCVPNHSQQITQPIIIITIKYDKS